MRKKNGLSGMHHTKASKASGRFLKRSIRGTHVHVSRKHLAKYLAEFEFRWNLRDAPETMFPLLLNALRHSVEKTIEAIPVSFHWMFFREAF